jgi:hypothetical protein
MSPLRVSLTAAFLLVASEVNAAVYAFSGRAVDPSGRPVPNVTIQVVTSDGRQIIRPVLTANGQFNFGVDEAYLNTPDLTVMVSLQADGVAPVTYDRLLAKSDHALSVVMSPVYAAGPGPSQPGQQGYVPQRKHGCCFFRRR